MIINKNLISNRKGFTLVESLVAISILLTAVVGPMSLIGDALHRINYARDEMIAINLAQEGIETVRQIQDSNMLAGALWNVGLSVGDYVVDVGGGSQVLLPLVSDQKVYLDAGLYRQGVTSPNLTQFSRLVSILSTSNLDELHVVSTVSWMTGGDLGTITTNEYIFKWAI